MTKQGHTTLNARRVPAGERPLSPTLGIVGVQAEAKLADELMGQHRVAGMEAAHAHVAEDLFEAVPFEGCAALDHLVRSMPAEVTASLVDELGEVSLLMPQLERMVPGLRRLPAADPETERYRLFNAVDALAIDAAQRWPTVVVIDDLHWAGAQTLALLRHLARSGPASRLLVIGTFRDTGDEITDPLASCLADLRRTNSTTRLRLTGLDKAAVERFVAGAVGHELNGDLRALAAVLAEHSGGNAFYVEELWRHLVASGGQSERVRIRSRADLGLLRHRESAAARRV